MVFHVDLDAGRVTLKSSSIYNHNMLGDLASIIFRKKPMTSTAVQTEIEMFSTAVQTEVRVNSVAVQTQVATTSSAVQTQVVTTASSAVQTQVVSTASSAVQTQVMVVHREVQTKVEMVDMATEVKPLTVESGIQATTKMKVNLATYAED